MKCFLCVFLVFFFGLFVWGFTSRLRIFHSYRDTTSAGEGLQIFNLIFSALVAIEQWGFLNVQHLLWHRASVHNYHLRGPVTFTPVAELLAVELSVSVFFYNLGLLRLRFEHPTACKANTLTDCATAILCIFCRKKTARYLFFLQLSQTSCNLQISYRNQQG